MPRAAREMLIGDKVYRKGAELPELSKRRLRDLQKQGAIQDATPRTETAEAKPAGTETADNPPKRSAKKRS